MLLHWELAQTFLSTSPQTCLSTFPQNKDSMYLGSLSILHTSLKKETWAICWKERERESWKREIWKRWWKKRAEWKKKSVKQKKGMSIKDSPWSQSSRFGESIFEESTFHSYPHTLALLIMFVCCFPPWIHALTLQHKHSKYAFQVLLPKTPHKS